MVSAVPGDGPCDEAAAGSSEGAGAGTALLSAVALKPPGAVTCAGACTGASCAEVCGGCGKTLLLSGVADDGAADCSVEVEVGDDETAGAGGAVCAGSAGVRRNRSAWC